MSVKRPKAKRARLSSEESYSSSMSSSISSSSSSSSDNNETDAKDLKPIKEYLTNRKELASQLFKSVKTEKIRMMLPQILKKMEFSDLEELCAAELIGMSKQRIMSILNGQEMQESSNTEESDDSGPSLEIISDTEWLSENETNIKVEGAKNNKNGKKLKKKSHDQKKSDLKTKLKAKGKGSSVKVKTEKIKIEKKEKEKEKEGESLLDLLELEMRARAIRALIRKEENTPDPKVTNAQSNNSTNSISGSGTSNDQKSRQASLKEQLEKIDVLIKHGEDEDVYVVIKPAPTIELLSSESENEDGTKRVNQKLVSERESKSKADQGKEQMEKAKEADVNKVKDSTDEKDASKENSLNKEKDESLQEKNESKEIAKNNNNKQTESEKENFNLPMSVTEDNTCIIPKNPSIPPEELEEGEIIDNDDDEEPVNEEKKIADDSPSRRIIKKVKKNPNIRPRKSNKENDDSDVESNKEIATEKEISNSENDKSSSKIEKTLISEEPIEIEDSPTRPDSTEKMSKSNVLNEDSNSKLDIFDDKALDIDEIINLDDYPDDMDDLEKNQANQEKKDPTNEANSSVKESKKETTKKTGSETWASRYYQQDDVQNVIKESKIQSEIRKRLRERQRQSKMNNSPKLKDQEESQSPEVMIPKPTGSVEEYLALKGLSSETCSEIGEGKSDSVGSFQSLKKDDSQSGEDNSAVVEDNLVSSSDNTAENNDSLVSANKLTSQPITIVKKPKIFEDIAFAKKVNSLLNENSSVEPTSSTPTCLERINLILSDKKIIIKEDETLKKRVILVKSPEKSDTQIQSTGTSDTPVLIHENLSSNKEIVEKESEEKVDLREDNIIVKMDSTLPQEKLIAEEEEKVSSPLKTNDMNNPKNDLSEDNAVVKMDSTLSQEKLPVEEVSIEKEQTLPSDPQASELRPN